MSVPGYETKENNTAKESLPSGLQASTPQKPSWMTDDRTSNVRADAVGGANADVPGDTDKKYLSEQLRGTFDRLFGSMTAGLHIAMRSIDDADIDEGSHIVGKLFEIAVDAAIAASAEALAIVAIEAIAVHAIEHAVARELESSEGLQEGIKVTLENSAKAVIGKHEAAVTTKDLKNEFLIKSLGKQSDLIGAFNQQWPSTAAGMAALPVPAVRSFVSMLNRIKGEQLNNTMELKYLTTWLNFLARAKHGAADPKHSAGHGAASEQDIASKNIDMWSTGGGFQRPPDLFGVLEVTLDRDGGGVVSLDNVGKDTRKALRRLGGVGAFSGLLIGDLKMNMLVRNGKWGTTIDELLVGADGAILNRIHPEPFELTMVLRAHLLRVANIRRDAADNAHDR